MNISFTTLIVSTLCALSVQTTFARSIAKHKCSRTFERAIAAKREKAQKIKNSTPKKVHQHPSYAQGKPHTH